LEIPTTRFGRLAVDPAEVITLPRGLFGFPAAHRYVLLDHTPGGPFKWLQSVDDPALAFVVVDPYQFFPEYEFELDEERARRLGIDRPEEARILTTVTLRSAPKEVTANLLGPLVVGTRTLRAEQLVLDAERYSTRHPLPLLRPARQPERVLQNVA
jgi:flagellar assembly factor FliW